VVEVEVSDDDVAHILAAETEAFNLAWHPTVGVPLDRCGTGEYRTGTLPYRRAKRGRHG
jgi:hypothetical protein